MGCIKENDRDEFFLYVGIMCGIFERPGVMELATAIAHADDQSRAYLLHLRDKLAEVIGDRKL